MNAIGAQYDGFCIYFLSFVGGKYFALDFKMCAVKAISK